MVACLHELSSILLVKAVGDIQQDPRQMSAMKHCKQASVATPLSCLLVLSHSCSLHVLSLSTGTNARVMMLLVGLHRQHQVFLQWPASGRLQATDVALHHTCAEVDAGYIAGGHAHGRH